MRATAFISTIVLTGLVAPAMMAAPAPSDAPINALCPIGKEPVRATAGTIEHDGHAIGLCCPGCGKAFLAWDEPRRDEFVRTALLGHGTAEDPGEPGTDSLPAASDEVIPYPLGTCIITGAELGSMGEPIVKVYDGREVKYCCAGCIKKFEADPAAAFKKLDDAIIEDQIRYYPLDTCIVSGEPLVEDGKDVAIDVVHQNRLVRFCCKGCARDFKADPATYIEKLDAEVAKAQRADYPLETCIVAGSDLGSMGEPSEMVVSGRLLRFCCAGCHPKVKKDSVKYLALIDAAWEAKGKYLIGEADDGESHDEPS